MGLHGGSKTGIVGGPAGNLMQSDQFEPMFKQLSGIEQQRKEIEQFINLCTDL